MSHIVINNPVARFAEQALGAELNLEISEDENAVLIGPNGGGKSLIANYICGGVSLASGEVSVLHSDGTIVPRTKIASLSFRDIYRAGGSSQDNYYQKRWQATENEESALVADVLGSKAIERGADLMQKLGVTPLLQKRVIFLSSGELRKLMIVRSMLTNPEVLVIDNPYIGLDAESRDTINTVLADISANTHVKILLLICHPKDMPAWIDTVIAVNHKLVLARTSRQSFLSDAELQRQLFAEMDITEAHLSADNLRAKDSDAYINAVIMNNVHVQYGDICILRDLSWTVKRGEKWALLGKNGCGKSTLLSLVCGDNPQGYANDITLFDHKRGTGESIWEIKSHIGYISPDMHTFYQADIPCVDVVASGFFDTIGLYRKPSDEQRRAALDWMRTFHCDHLAQRSFLKMSYGEQRLILLTRVFVKSPSLVILDEPLHGLDAGKKNLAKLLIEDYCSDPNVTLVYVTHYVEEIPNVVSLRKELIKQK